MWIFDHMGGEDDTPNPHVIQGSTVLKNCHLLEKYHFLGHLRGSGGQLVMTCLRLRS